MLQTRVLAFNTRRVQHHGPGGVRALVPCVQVTAVGGRRTADALCRRRRVCQAVRRGSRTTHALTAVKVSAGDACHWEPAPPGVPTKRQRGSRVLGLWRRRAVGGWAARWRGGAGYWSGAPGVWVGARLRLTEPGKEPVWRHSQKAHPPRHRPLHVPAHPCELSKSGSTRQHQLHHCNLPHWRRWSCQTGGPL